jgi:hypothetical protein
VPTFSQVAVTIPLESTVVEGAVEGALICGQLSPSGRKYQSVTPSMPDAVDASSPQPSGICGGAW